MWIAAAVAVCLVLATSMASPVPTPSPLMAQLQHLQNEMARAAQYYELLQNLQKEIASKNDLPMFEWVQKEMASTNGWQGLPIPFPGDEEPLQNLQKEMASKNNYPMFWVQKEMASKNNVPMFWGRGAEAALAAGNTGTSQELLQDLQKEMASKNDLPSLGGGGRVWKR